MMPNPSFKRTFGRLSQTLERMNSLLVVRVSLSIATLLLLAPTVRTLVNSPYGLNPPELWLAALYLFGITLAAIAFATRVPQLASSTFDSQRALRLTVSMVTAVVCWLLACLLPFALLIGTYQVFGRFSGGSRWVLFNKYVELFATSMVNDYYWLGALAIAISTVVWLQMQTHKSSTR